MRTLGNIIANRELIAVTSKQTAWDAANLMATRHVGAVLVIDGKKLNGIVTERDIMTRVVVPKRNPETIAVTEIMTRNPSVLGSANPFSHALILMAEGGFRHMPVVDGDVAVGVVSIRDAIGAEQAELEQAQQTFEHIAGHIR